MSIEIISRKVYQSSSEMNDYENSKLNNYFKKNIHQVNKNGGQGHNQFPNLQVLEGIKKQLHRVITHKL